MPTTINELQEFTDKELQEEMKKRKDKSHLVEELEDIKIKIKELEIRKEEIVKQLSK